MRKLTAEDINKTTRSKIDLPAVKAALKGIDQEAVLKETQSEWSCVEWDRESPINGNPAAKILFSRPDIPAVGLIYLIKEGDNVVYFQPVVPRVNGRVPMTDRGTFDKIRGDHLANAVLERAYSRIKTMALEAAAAAS